MTSPSVYDLPWSKRTAMFPARLHGPRGAEVFHSGPPLVSRTGTAALRLDQYIGSSYFGQTGLPNSKHERGRSSIFGTGPTYRYPGTGLRGVNSVTPGPDRYQHVGSVGKQPLSFMNTEPIISLGLTEGRWARMDAELARQRMSPGPGAYKIFNQ